jgi:hypothetical protein
MDETNTAPEAEHEQNDNGYTATYSPEDNKLRLYIGRVPRDEYEKLRAEGWVTLHKQREVGGGDFAATWTPERRDTALEYAGIIEDEDMGPEERAADRAERFGGYRDKRLGEATGRADAYDAGPSAHGYQSAARAERAVRRHDRLAARSVDAWDKADYWQRRTAGVIAHALFKSSPSVRMGRIKTLEADLRRAMPGGDWANHLALRLAYENQMLEAQGGRAAHVEMIPGGWLGSKQIHKVNKSSVTGRVVSVFVKVTRVDGWVYQVHNVPGTDYALAQVNTERLPANAYRPPTAEELEKFEAEQKAEKKARKASAPPTIPLVNPTDADAEKLQAIWNESKRVEFEAEKKRNPYSGIEFKPQTVCRITQGTYSANSKGAYAKAETKPVCEGGLMKRESRYGGYERKQYENRPTACKVRSTRGEAYMAWRVIVLTDAPQKPLPAAVWEPLKKEPVFTLEAETVNA